MFPFICVGVRGEDHFTGLFIPVLPHPPPRGWRGGVGGEGEMLLAPIRTVRIC